MPSEASAKEGCPSSTPDPASLPSASYAFVIYVYLVESLSIPGQRYVGSTADLKQRLRDHNDGKSPHTAKYLPWRLVTYVAFSNRVQAEAFGRYLKSGSGHAFAAKRLWG
jgi:putative endonuclease